MKYHPEPDFNWFSNLQPRKRVHQLHCLEADGDHAEEEVEGVAGVVHGFEGPGVGVVDDAGVLVGFDALTFDDPVEGGFAVDYVFVGLEGNVGDGDVGVVDEGGLVAFLGVFHLFNAVEDLGGEGVLVAGDRGRVLVHGLVVDVQVGQGAAGAGKGPEVGGGLDAGDARQLLGEIVRVAGAIVRGVEQPVDVVEDILFGQVLARVGGLEVGETGVGERGAPLALGGRGLGTGDWMVEKRSGSAVVAPVASGSSYR